MSEAMVPWIGDLIGKGYDLPGGRADVFRPRAGFVKPDDRGYRYIPAVFTAEDSDAAFLTDRFLEWLQARSRRPFFAHVVFLRPHPPLVAPEPYNAMVHPKDVAMPHRAATPEEEGAQHPFLKYRIDGYRRPGSYEEHSPIAPATAPDLEIRQMMATYFGLVAEVDHHLGRIVAHLKATGEYDRTLIVFTSDHAEMLGEHYVWSKEIYFDQAFRVPLVIRDPRAAGRAGKRVTRFTEAIDVAPTIIERIGGRGAPRHGRPLAAAVPRRGRRRRTGGPRSSSSTTSAKWSTPAAGDARSASAPDECCYAVIRDDRLQVRALRGACRRSSSTCAPIRTRPPNLAERPEMQDVRPALRASRLLTGG